MMRANRSKDGDEWRVMSHEFLRHLKWLKSPETSVTLDPTILHHGWTQTDTDRK